MQWYDTSTVKNVSEQSSPATVTKYFTTIPMNSKNIWMDDTEKNNANLIDSHFDIILADPWELQ